MARTRIEGFRRAFEHDSWANRSMLEALEALRAPPERAVRLLAHVLAAERLWWTRLRGEAPPAVWPEHDLARCRVELERLDADWGAVLGALDPGRLDSRVGYVNSRGERWENAVEDVLDHVLLHSSHHRGQIAYELRAAGHEPPYVDLIHAVRTGRIGGGRG